MTARILVTGGFGYIGGRVTQALHKAGHVVFLGSRHTNRATPTWLPKAQVTPLDWNSASALQHACAGMDAVVHLAAMNEVEAARDPVGALQMNGVASVQLLEAAIAARVQRFIYFSTAHIYGAPLEGRIDESTLPRPQHPYAITHKVSEDFVLAAHDQARIEGVVLRLSNAFGAPAAADVDRWSLIANDLCRQAVTHGELRLRSAGTQLRDFISLNDVARAVVHTLALPRAALADGLFNLGGDAALPVIDMAQLIVARWQAMTGNTLPLHRPEPTGDAPTALHYVCDKFKATGFSHTDDFPQEIDATLQLCLQAFGADQTQ